MLAKAIQKGFPKDVKLPADLTALCDFADEHDSEVSGNFEFDTNGQASALAWFDNDSEPAKQFAVFGSGPDGSLYALWLHAGTDATVAPVVLLDSECAGSAVIASDMREFLRLLAIGYEEPGQYPTLEPEDPDSAEALRDWVTEEFGVTIPATGAEIVTAAQARHPNLMAWIEQWQAKRAG